MRIKPFISYAREDVNVAQKLYGDLRTAGAQPWIDVEDLLGGQDFELTITNAIRTSSHFLALISANSVNKRGFVQKELRHALEILQTFPPSETFLIPVRLNSTKPRHEILSALHWIDLFPSYQDGFNRLKRSLGFEPPSVAASILKIPEVNTKIAMRSQTNSLFTRDGAGFLTVEAIVKIVLERVQGNQMLLHDPILLFANHYQRTWFVVTEQIAACVLDDNTKSDIYDPLRWECRHRFAMPVEVEAYRKKAGLIHFGSQHREWLYSINLHPDPFHLKSEIEALLKSG